MIRLELMIALNVVLLISLAPLISSPSLAAKPHLSGTPDIIKDSDLSITVNYQAKELGKKTANVTLSSHTTALIGCVNPGGQLSPSKGVQSEETQSQSVQIKPKDGKIKGSLNSGPPTFPSVLSVCPNKNWHTSILSLTYENVVMVIQQKNSEILKFNFGNIP